MRFLTSFPEQRQALELSLLLAQNSIDHNLESHFVEEEQEASDSESKKPSDQSQAATLPANLPDNFYEIWVIAEEDFPKAQEILNALESAEKQQTAHPPLDSPSQQFHHPKSRAQEEPDEKSTPTTPRHSPFSFCLLWLCILFFIVPWLSSASSTHPTLYSPIVRLFLYDFPKAEELRTELVEQYTAQQLREGSLPEEGKALLNEFQTTPEWKGLYPLLIDTLRPKLKEQQAIQRNDDDAPLFEKIRQGELWRVLTPIFLHSNLLHILFNMIWLVTLGYQVEQRLSSARYLLFILITAVISNSTQYLVSGFAFLGISGVISALFAYIWMRQKIAPWEGYQLHRNTSLFLLCYLGGVLLLQVVDTALMLFTGSSSHLAIANSAHVSGFLTGLLLAKSRLFTPPLFAQ